MNEQGVDPAEQLTLMFTELANDPDAPPSTVTAESVLAAARASTSDMAKVGSSTAGLAAGTGEPDAAQGPAPERDELAARRARRRRTGLTALVAAASVAAIAAVVIPLALSSSESTSTSAGESQTDRAFSASSGAAAGAPASESDAVVPLAGGAQPAPTPPAVPGVTNPASSGPASSDSAVAADAQAAGSAAATGSGCWPALPDPAVAALIATLPPDAFGSPEALTTGCVPDPIGGAVLPGLARSEVPTAITVRVQKAEPGACRQAAAVAERCAPATEGVYLRLDPAGPSAFVYGGGNQVQVGGSTTGSGAAISTGLSQQQLAAAARAVLAAL